MRSQIKRRGSFLALLVVFALVAAACGNGADDTTTTEAPSQDTTTTAAPLPGEGVKIGMAYDIGGRGDKSFNDSAAAGLDRAIAD
ncbi:MAG: BMP family ABC transporter substrate-binding protein, partial [Actinomycetota bacterium]|nr:BMP family ABC transporter substrate-binding protein [Actinomycetota bacterium]MDK1026146.1 BMP family ABC transporter substrate-binding protein [Actinomycetota bacterium]